MVIANSSTVSPLLYGKFDDEELTINGETTIVTEDLVFGQLPPNDSDIGIKFEQGNFNFMGMVYEGSNGYNKKIHFKAYDQGLDYNVLTVDYNGNVGVGTDAATHKLEVEGTKSNGHIMKIKNNSTSQDADGLEIELSRSKNGNNNHYITFTQGLGTAGRIEGFRTDEGLNFTSFPDIDFAKYFDLPEIEAFFDTGALPNLTGGVLPTLNYTKPTLSIVRPTLSGGIVSFNTSTMANCAISAGLNCSNPLSATPINFTRGSWDWDDGSLSWSEGDFPMLTGGRKPGIDFSIYWNPPRPSDAWSDVRLVLKWAQRNGLGILGLDAFNTQYYKDPNYWSNLALSKDGGVTYGSLGADYAEWLERKDVHEEITGGQIVGVHNGKVSLNTEDAEQLMVVSIQPIVLGNMPDSLHEDDFEKIAFIGQAPTWVVGKVKSGDYIIPSGHHDGFGIAVSPQEITLDQISLVVGRAWEDGNELINMINMSVGLKTDEMANVMKRFQNEFNHLESRVDHIESVLNMSAQK